MFHVPRSVFTVHRFAVRCSPLTFYRSLLSLPQPPCSLSHLAITIRCCIDQDAQVAVQHRPLVKRKIDLPKRLLPSLLPPTTRAIVSSISIFALLPVPPPFTVVGRLQRRTARRRPPARVRACRVFGSGKIPWEFVVVVDGVADPELAAELDAANLGEERGRGRR